MLKVCWIVTMLAALPAAFLVWMSFAGGASAPQQAALAAVACAIVVIPYVFTRAIEGLTKAD